jgi:hypothetical protein
MMSLPLLGHFQESPNLLRRFPSLDWIPAEGTSVGLDSQAGKPRGRLAYLEDPSASSLRKESFGPTIVPHLDSAFEHKVGPGRRESPKPLSSFGRLAPQGLMKKVIAQ